MNILKVDYFRWIVLVLMTALSLLGSTAQAQETVCARVKIEIKQKLTLERQGFDAQMKISNTLDNASLSDVDITVHVTEENGTPVPITTNPDDLSAKFYIRLSHQENIADISGNGVVTPSSTAVINWLLIPAPGAAGETPSGKNYLIGATLKYKFGGETHTLDVSPDLVTVKPMPLLTLDYFLTKDVIGDDPMTLEVEPVEPFTLGVRVKNTGMAVAKSLKIESAQPRIVENEQGLAINFTLTGSYVDDAPVENTLLINFNDIAAGKSKMGRWNMESTLAGEFVEFNATFTHADELGGALTSLLQATNAHFLIHDVRVDLPGRDMIRDFLAQDGDVVRVYESDGQDTIVTDLSSQTQLIPGSGQTGADYKLTLPPTAGFLYARIADPNRGAKSLGTVVRSDAKTIPPENIWLSKTKNRDTQQWQYWLNIFDANSTGQYDIGVQAGVVVPRAPVLQFIPDRITTEKQNTGFLVEASSPDGKPVTIAASPLPVGATFNDQGNGIATFDWTPIVGQAGSYLITYTASDGKLTASRSASITVETLAPPPGPGTPSLVSPLVDEHIRSLTPTLKILAGQHSSDPTVSIIFELYKDEAMTQQIATGTVAKNAVLDQPTAWIVSERLNDNTHYWWRARAVDNTQHYSLWANGRFFTNLFNDAPAPFNLTSPVADAEVDSLTPVLTLNNTTDADGDAITYGFQVYNSTQLTDAVAQVDSLEPGSGGQTSWTVDPPLTNHATYYWRATASDSHGAQTQTPARQMTINTGNAAPTTPVIISPAIGGQSQTKNVPLTVQNATDADGDRLTYHFEIDTEATFNTGNRQSGTVAEGNGGQTVWTAVNLLENQRYYWRVRATDGRTNSEWVLGNFLVNEVNDPPPATTIKNPGDKAWVSTLYPLFEANLVLDPEGDSVRYRFEIYKDKNLQNKVTEGLAEQTQWTPSSALADKTTYYWRLRAEDDKGAASAWTEPYTLYVSTVPYTTPSIAVTAPATQTDGSSGTVTIRWEGTDQNIDPTIALYYDTTGSGYAGTRIIDGLKQPAGTASGSYVWDVSTLPPGIYYIYGIIYDPKGTGKAYASGTIVRPKPNQAGQIVVAAPSMLSTDDKTKTATFTVKLGRAPVSNVRIGMTTTDPMIGKVAPESLTFTPANWNIAQTVTASGVEDCVKKGTQRYQVVFAGAESLDLDYVGLTSKALEGMNSIPSSTNATNNPNIFICNYKLVEKKLANPTTWEYAYKVTLVNTGNPVSKINVMATGSTPSGSFVNRNIEFGAIGKGETVISEGTVTLRYLNPGLADGVIPTMRWNVTVTP